eukprot:1189863-Prorocentrum_minimum.AAC.2
MIDRLANPHLVDLRRGDLPHAELLLLSWHLHEPRKEAAIIDERLPLAVHTEARFAAEEHDHALISRRNETKQENITASAVVALQQSLAQNTIPVQVHLSTRAQITSASLLYILPTTIMLLSCPNHYPKLPSDNVRNIVRGGHLK